jgi:hypothetical protein
MTIMSQFLNILSDNPQGRRLERATRLFVAVAWSYCRLIPVTPWGCLIDAKTAIERIKPIRQIVSHDEYPLIFRDLSEIAIYTKIDKSAHRLLRSLMPGPYIVI